MISLPQGHLARRRQGWDRNPDFHKLKPALSLLSYETLNLSAWCYNAHYLGKNLSHHEEELSDNEDTVFWALEKNLGLNLSRALVP